MLSYNLTRLKALSQLKGVRQMRFWKWLEETQHPDFHRQGVAKIRRRKPKTTELLSLFSHLGHPCLHRFLLWRLYPAPLAKIKPPRHNERWFFISKIF